VDVVREGKTMAAQGPGNGGDFGDRGGSRGAGFNPGFNPGFDPGFGGRGQGHGFQQRGRGRGFGGHGGGHNAHGGFGYNGYGYNSGYHGAGLVGRPYDGRFGGGRVRGGWNHGRPHQHQIMGPQPVPAGHPQHPNNVGGQPPLTSQQMGTAVMGHMLAGQGEHHPLPNTVIQEGASQETGQGKEPVQQGAAPNTTGAVPSHATGSTSTIVPAAATTQVTPEAQKAALPPIANQAVANEVPNSSHHGGQKNKGKPFCYRCHTKGHTIHECTAVLYCDLCCGDHVTKICPNMKK